MYTHNEILCSCKKEGNPATYNNMNECGEHYARWNKLNTGQIPYDTTCMMSLK